MAVSDSLALSSPYIAPKVDAKQERLRERRADLRPCPECGTEAEFEPPVITIQPGQLAHQLTVIRCPQCGTISRREILTEDYAAIQPREEPAPMITPEAPLCECGCGEPVTVDNSPAGKGQRWRRFASKKCAGRARHRAAGNRDCHTGPEGPYIPQARERQREAGQKSSPSPEAVLSPGHEPQGSRPGPSGEGTPPWHPGAVVAKTEPPWFAPASSEPSPRAQALAYLLSLSQEQRDAFGALLEAEATCRRLGVA